MRGDSDEDQRSKRARTSLEGNARDIANPPNVTTGTAQQHEQHHQQERRATQACFRCRKQKLRCLGGRPCVRCVKASKECDFGQGNAGNVAYRPNVTVDAAQYEQHHQQERRATQACFRCRKQKLRCLGGRPCVRCVKASKECDFGKPGQASPVSNSNNNTNTNGDVVEDRHGAAARASLVRLEDSVTNLLAGLQNTGTNGTDLFPALTAAPDTVSSTVPVTAPAPAPAPPLEPSSYHATALTNTATPALLSTSDPLTTQGLGHVRFGDSPEVNFISPHSYSSRTETTSPSGEHDVRTGNEHRDNEGEERLASATKDGFGPPFQSLVYQRYPSLFSAILAISARFYLRSSSKAHIMDSHVPKALAEIAESHLAHTLLRKKHTLADVQAILLLAAWGLQSSGKGPDAWVLTGHAARVSRRLGIQRAVGQAVAATQKDRSQLEAPAEVDTAVLRRWRTW
ncbi:unnamed protein product [Alternaria alternata]